MGDVNIPYYVTRKAWPGSKKRWGYWAPCLKRRNPKTGRIEPTLMAKLGFALINCGEDGARAWAIAEAYNVKWRAARAAYLAGAVAVDPSQIERVFPPNSLGEGFARYRRTNEWRSGKKPRTREDWWRGWKHIEPVFGDVDPRTVTLEDVDLWYAGDPDDPSVKGLLETIGVREAHRAMKIWRAMWYVVGSLKRNDGEHYCERDNDPSLGIRRKTPKPRSAFWNYDELRQLVKGAWRLGYRGLAAALAVSWDTMLSPVDVRTLTLAQLTGDAEGPFFSLDRTKSGAAAIGTLSHKTQRVLKAYMTTLPPNLLKSAPIFYTRGHKATRKGGKPRPPVPYTADTFGDDFRDVRSVVFPGAHRQISDFRRSGAIEVKAGHADDKTLAGKMANTIDKSRMLRETYLPATALPPDATLVRMADASRLRGRTRLRGAKGEDR